MGYWKLNGSSTDYSGNNNNGTDTSMSYIPGLFDKCGVFNGTSSLITTGLNPSTTLGQNFTISAWIYPNIGNNYRGVAGNHYSDASTSYGIVFAQYRDGFWYFGYGTNTATFPTVSTDSIIYNQWNHVVAVYRGSNGIDLYINGVFVKSATATLPINHTTSFWIGKAFNSSERFFLGYVEEFIIETKIWTANDVKEYYGNKIKGLGYINIVPAVATDSLFSFTTATFYSPLTAGNYSSSASLATWCYGPTSAECLSYYQSISSPLYSLLNVNTYMKVPYNGYQWFTVPSTGNYTIIAQGGNGGATNVAGRNGCKITATFALTKGDILWITVGQAGSTGNAGSSDYCSAGGGGATFVCYAPSNGGTTLSNVTKCLICAAGGLGAREARFGSTRPAASSSANGSSGTAFTSNFKNANLNGAAGGYGGYYAKGGFGGGTGTDDSWGSAGGYDGLFSSVPNSFVDASGVSVNRVDDGDYRWSSGGYVTITKV